MLNYRRFLFLLGVFVLITECKPKKTALNDATLALPPQISIWEAPVNPPAEEFLHFQLLETVLFDDSVQFKLKYGGGCIKPHIFECYTSGMKSQDGVFDLYLIHKTKDDRCKALVHTERTYYWGNLFNSGDRIRINGGTVMTIPSTSKKP